ncbi:predicted protein [Uncinocarpus reesii 1704]|uniref:Uncharacterized protein n=1 Tax=Uncinocarpus reesii (strain UAMH 1704) TaxID=336963 RepID=C4JPR3_UNCRE|nr:uncharacterized protein UREG_04556 [Uncinocarpus reesii 1704]EEP79710.1 predicted protein [Uncinocarpus reesii 1704]
MEPATIIPKLPVLPRAPESLRNVPVILATPALAAWAQAHNTLLPSIMSHIFRDALQMDKENAELYSISAVVDKLPIPNSASAQYLAPLEQQGYEGISLLLTDQDSLSGDIARPMRRRDVSMPEIEPTITYAVTHAQGDETVFTEIGIRVANTIFVTGKPRTMLASRWQRDKDTTSLKLKETKDLVICRIQSATRSPVVTPYIPLYPVTQPRKVVASMGNVLSQISTGNGSTKSGPASAELEKALPEYIEKHKLQNHKLAVWALVRPEGHTKPLSEDEDYISNVSGAIQSGARLHRLMSGGGGWGKKQGLLSLDPEYSYQEEHSSGHRHPINELFLQIPQKPDINEFPSDPFPNLMEFNDGKLVTPLSEAAKPGDTVQFFVAPLDTGVPIHHSQNSKSAKKTAEDCIFGVIPSADESSFPSTDNQDDLQKSTQTLSNDLVVLHNYFGALSEKGITFTTVEKGIVKGRRSLEPPGTKIDVPGSRIVIGT